MKGSISSSLYSRINSRDFTPASYGPTLIPSRRFTYEISISRGRSATFEWLATRYRNIFFSSALQRSLCLGSLAIFFITNTRIKYFQAAAYAPDFAHAPSDSFASTSFNIW
ncbi:hypothetical protein ATM99_10315 [Cellulomonas sp. B6]|nr:hypothetical protein ATM99_10315 [Cellulomonas sp. B6]